MPQDLGIGDAVGRDILHDFHRNVLTQPTQHGPHPPEISGREDPHQPAIVPKYGFACFQEGKAFFVRIEGVSLFVLGEDGVAGNANLDRIGDHLLKQPAVVHELQYFLKMLDLLKNLVAQNELVEQHARDGEGFHRTAGTVGAGGRGFGQHTQVADQGGTGKRVADAKLGLDQLRRTREQ